ncbi:MAG: DUF3014 domain-containing protein [Methylovulum sp.]|nr:DUF3014 domain-containing protein [Methylovulum sp.]
MGRYDRDSGRYSRLKSKNGNGIPFWAAVILMVSTAGAGYFARPFIDHLLEPFNPTALLTPETALLPPLPKLTSPEPTLTTTEIKPPETAPDSLEPLVTPPAPIILPELDSSDNEFRKATATAAPELAPWLASDGLIRKFVVLTNDLAQGQRISKHLEFLKLSQAFTVKTEHDGLFIAPESQQRYNALALAIDHLDANAILGVYQIFKPLFQQVFSEFSYPDDYTLETLFSKAATEILAAPIIEGPIPVIKHLLHYQFADPQLEAMNPVHKQMLRMGPENTRIIQNKARGLLDKLLSADKGK